MDSPEGFPGIGDKLSDRFRIVFGRGSGPLGSVYKALDLALDLPVAVKVFRPELFDSEFKEQNQFRLYRARAYQDPNLVKIFEVQEDNGLHFITCQLMEGMSLASILDLHAESGEHFTVQKIRAITKRIMSGLSVIHGTGVSHGNLKPRNIYVLPDRLALSDPYYLLYKRLEEGEEIPVEDYYRGPEQLSDPSLDLKESDIYSMTLVTGELITGNPVQPGTPLSEQVPRLTGCMDEFFVKATSSEPFDRFRTLEEYGETLMDVLDEVESEGLWKRRYHETGSFRAIKVKVPEDQDSGITPLPEKAPEPEEVIEPEETIEPEELTDVEEVVDVEEIVEAEEVVEVEDVVDAGEQTVEEEAPDVEDEGVVIDAGDMVDGEEEEVGEGIEVVPEDMPPPPPEAAEDAALESDRTIAGMPAITEGDLKTDDVEDFMMEVPEEQIDVDAPPVPPEALEEAEYEAGDQLPEAEDGRLDMESVVQDDAEDYEPPSMAPFERVEDRAEPAPIRTFILLFSLFVVVGGAAVLMYMKFGGPAETGDKHAAPEPAKIETAAPKAVVKPPKPEPQPAATVMASRDVVVERDSGVAAEPAAASATVETEAGADVEPTPPPVPAPELTLAEKLKCRSGMVKVVIDPDAGDTPDIDLKKVAFCMDAYEYPGMGKKPKTKVSMSSAKRLCGKADKVLCTPTQWKMACARTYPYGDQYREGACNVEGPIKATGSFPDCVTPTGIYDLVGNASEWCTDKRVHGGDNNGGSGNTCAVLDKRFMPGPTNGFRCCAGPEL